MNGKYKERGMRVWKEKEELPEKQFCSMCGHACSMGNFGEEFADEYVRE
jgi:hypothetical protein